MIAILAQLGDAVPDEAWYVILYACPAVPILFFALGTFIWRGRFARSSWKYFAGYYVIALPLNVIPYWATEHPTPACLALLVDVVGPLYGLIVFLVQVPQRMRSLGGGRCVKCDYDLTGNTTQRCPECGTQWS